MRHVGLADTSIQRLGDFYQAKSSLKILLFFVARQKAPINGSTSPKHHSAKIGLGEVCVVSTRCF